MSGGRGQAVTLKGESGGSTSIYILLPGFFGPTANDITANWLRIDGTFALAGASAHVVGKTAPGGSAPFWDIKRSADNGGSWASILPSGIANKIYLAVGAHVSDQTPDWQVDTLDDGDLLAVDLVQTDDGTGANITISIVPT